MPPRENKPLDFMETYTAVGSAPQEFQEPIASERLIDYLIPRANVLSEMPYKYLNALIHFTDLRVLQLTTQMQQAADTITVAHVRGQMREVENLQNTLRWWLEMKRSQ